MTTSPPFSPIALHYFRLPRHTWELMLIRMKQLGADAIFTPVPWGFHEIDDNQFDLSGITTPRRNVLAFVETCAAMGFPVILDLFPGPDAGLLFGGFPVWLLRKHPETQASDQPGNPLPAVTLQHPTTLKYARRWLEQLTQSLPEDVALQLKLKNYLPDFSDHIAAVQWPIWLRKRYAQSGLAGLNAAYASPTPFSSFSRIPLNAQLDSPAFQQDVQEFYAGLGEGARQSYSQILLELGRELGAAIDSPLHGAQITPDPADAGAGFQWAMDAPLRPDGTPRPNFWALKKANLQKTLPDDAPLYPADPAAAVALPVAANTLVGRLMLDGRLEQSILDADADATTLSAQNQSAAADLYFTLPGANAPLPDYLADYLRSLLAGKTQALAYCAEMVEQLLQAFEKPSPPAKQKSDAPDASLSEAQAALTQANQALYKAASSIGALEEVFATALDKTQTPETTPTFFSLDAVRFKNLQSACQTLAPILNAASQSSLPAAFTLEQYVAAHRSVANAAAQSFSELNATLRWLREEMAANALPSTGWIVHARVQTILQSLSVIAP
ncbi:MAG TPA: hypothetical protein G4N96_14490 [Chloroflexi bacterium]|nr:hypothetical protein [Chloroflexota bacterium]